MQFIQHRINSATWCCQMYKQACQESMKWRSVYPGWVLWVSLWTPSLQEVSMWMCKVSGWEKHEVITLYIGVWMHFLVNTYSARHNKLSLERQYKRPFPFRPYARTCSCQTPVCVVFEYSYHLNPINNFWHELKEFIRREVKPTSQEQLISGIRAFWETVIAEKCQKYIGHLKKVIPEVIACERGTTGYWHCNINFMTLCAHYWAVICIFILWSSVVQCCLNSNSPPI